MSQKINVVLISVTDDEDFLVETG